MKFNTLTMVIIAVVAIVAVGGINYLYYCISRIIERFNFLEEAVMTLMFRVMEIEKRLNITYEERRNKKGEMDNEKDTIHLL